MPLRPKKLSRRRIRKKRKVAAKLFALNTKAKKTKKAERKL